MPLLQDFESALTAARAELDAAADAAGVEAVRVHYLGRRGVVQELMAGLAKLSPAEKPEAGRVANRVKNGIQEALDAALARLEAGRPQLARALDVTLPG